ncbi:DNA-processing protein DprA, partial [Candidatus Woesebacteria bacterium]|nr:DNA-processing protein DprA [Candidatus Woesebacteria bacterium]
MKEGIYKRHWKDKTYPKNLLALPENERPELLYISGKIKKSDRKAVAIVGSRKTTTYGRKMA